MKKYYLVILIFIAFSGCKKESEWLDAKSTKSDVVPSTLQDYQALLDNDKLMNESYGALCVISNDNMYVQFAKWQAALNAQERNTYTWSEEIYNGEIGFDWRNLYQKVGQANIVLDGIEKLNVNHDDALYQNIKGSALFYRALCFYNLVQEFSKPFDPNTADIDLGIVLKVSGAVQEKIVRSSVRASYNKILEDLDIAESLLPVTQPYKTRPTKLAVWALKARIFLGLGDYTNAMQFSKSVLLQVSTLLDYNTLSSTPVFTFPTYQTGNPEILFYCQGSSMTLSTYNTMLVDPELYSFYSNNDLRKSLFYRDNGVNGITFRGNYSATGGSQFHGCATNELYLIYSECAARAGNTDDAMSQLNALLIKRYKTGTFLPLTASSSDDALNQILKERRKELPYTGNLRWEDLRRLNKEPRFAKTLTRILNGTTYTLPPNSNRYALPIPDAEIQISGIQQNERN